MSLSTADFFFDDIIDCSPSDLTEGGWTTAIGTKIKLQGESGQELIEIIKESTTSATVSQSRLLDDMPARIKIWEKIFKDTPMPVTQSGSIEESYGLLDSCFWGKKITANEVLDLLKKSK